MKSNAAYTSLINDLKCSVDYKLQHKTLAVVAISLHHSLKKHFLISQRTLTDKHLPSICSIHSKYKISWVNKALLNSVHKER